MRILLLAAVMGVAIYSGCNRPTAPSDTDQQQGNPKAQPEKSATSHDSKQPGDNQAGRDAHTGHPSSPQR